MKKIIISLCCCTTPLFASEILTSCPTGYVSLDSNSTATIYSETCDTGYVSTDGVIPSCMGSDDPLCLLYAPVGMSFVETVGTYDYTEDCWISEGDTTINPLCAVDISDKSCYVKASGDTLTDWDGDCDGVSVRGLALCGSAAQGGGFDVGSTYGCRCVLVYPYFGWFLSSSSNDLAYSFANVAQCHNNCLSVCIEYINNHEFSVVSPISFYQ